MPTTLAGLRRRVNPFARSAARPRARPQDVARRAQPDAAAPPATRPRARCAATSTRCTFQVGKDSRDMLRAHPAHTCATTSPRSPSRCSTSMTASVAGRPERAVSTQRGRTRQARIRDLKAELARVERARRPGTGAGRALRWRASPRAPDAGSRDAVRRCCRTIDTYRDQPAGRSVAAAPPRPASTSRCGVAIAGKVKAGKSTLLNALVGEEIAPTDAGECTRVVTWYLRRARADGRAAPPRRRPPRPLRDPPATTARWTSTWPASPSSGSTGWWCTGRRRACAPRR